MIGRGFLLSALAGFSISFANAQSNAIQRIHVVERGIYRADTINRTDAPGTTGVINKVQNPRLISSTATVLAQVGVRFGLRYVPLGATGTDVRLKLVITFPPGGLRNPGTGQVAFQSELMVTVPTGATHYWEYNLENEWEVVAGVWTFEFWQHDRKLGEQRFCVHDLKKQGLTTAFSNVCNSSPMGVFR